MEVRQRMKLTGTNSSFGLIALISQCPQGGLRAAGVKDQSCHPVFRRPGGSCEGPKPDPIPNSAVKPLSANGTKSQGLGESVAARPAKHRITNAAAMRPSHELFSIDAHGFRLHGAPDAPLRPTPTTPIRGVEQSGSSSGS